jgi:hypothetical protein
MPRRRGRPPKYGTPSKIVAVTLPEEAVAELGTIHEDLGWAIVRLIEQHHRPSLDTAKAKEPASKARRMAGAKAVAAAELVSVGAGQSLIVVNSATVRSIPGVQMIPLSDTEAFLALDPGRGLADLEIAVVDHYERLRTGSRDKEAISQLLAKLRRWRRDERLAFHSRAIILVSGT